MNEQLLQATILELSGILNQANIDLALERAMLKQANSEIELLKEKISALESSDIQGE